MKKKMVEQGRPQMTIYLRLQIHTQFV